MGKSCTVNGYSTYGSSTTVRTDQKNTEVKIKEVSGDKRTWTGKTDEDGKINISTTSAPSGGLECECV
jgi:hypothetical protein